MPKLEVEQASSLARIAEGLRFARARPELIGTYVVDIVAMTFAMPMALFPHMGERWGGASAAGWLYSAMAIGSLIMTLFSGWTSRVNRQGAAVVWAAALWPCSARSAPARGRGRHGAPGRRVAPPRPQRQASVERATAEVLAHLRAPRYGHLGWLRQRIPLDQILAARTTQVDPTADHGGWGYRGSLTLQRKAAVIIRAGSALALDLRGNQHLTITVDGAETAAALIRSLLDRSPPLRRIRASADRD